MNMGSLSTIMNPNDDVTSYEDLSVMHKGYLTPGSISTDGVIQDDAGKYTVEEVRDARSLLDARNNMIYFIDRAVKQLSEKGLPITYDNLADAFILHAKDDLEDGPYADYLKLDQYCKILSSVFGRDEFSCCGYFPIFMLKPIMSRACKEIEGAIELEDPDLICLRLERLSCGYEQAIFGIDHGLKEPAPDDIVTAVVAKFPGIPDAPYCIVPSLMIATGKYSKLVETYGTTYRPYAYLNECPLDKAYILGFARDDVDDALGLQKYVNEHVVEMVENGEVDGDMLLDIAYKYFEEN